MRIPCLRAVFHNLQRCCNVTLIHGLAHLMPFAQADPELFLGQAADRTASGTPVTGAPRELATALSFFEKFVQIRINIISSPVNIQLVDSRDRSQAVLEASLFEPGP